VFLNQQEGPRRALEEQARALEFLESRGLVSLVDSERPRLVESLLYAGRWEETVVEAGTIESSMDANFPASTLFLVRQMRLLALSWQGELDATDRRLERALQASQASALDVDEASGLLIAALVAARSSPDHALELLEWVLATMTPGTSVWCAALMPEAARVAVSGNDSALAGFAAAAARWHEFGVPYEEAQALLGEGRCLVALGKAPEAAAPLAAAREIFARLAAKPALSETDELLGDMPSF
jgi:hypothetical protein